MGDYERYSVQRRSYIIYAVLLILITILVVLLLLGNLQYTTSYSGGRDFVTDWAGMRWLLYKGQSPYKVNIHEIIFEMIGEDKEFPSEFHSKFVSPIYSVYIYAPFALVKDYVLARALWMTVLELGILGILFLSYKLSRWRVSKIWLTIISFFIALSYPVLISVIRGNLAVISTLFVVSALLAIDTKHDALAGILLAFATIKPGLVILLIPFVLLWAISRRLYPLIWSFIGSLGLLVASISLLIPNWIVDYIRQFFTLPADDLSITPGSIFSSWLPGVGSQLGWVLTFLLISIIIWEWKAAFGREFSWFLWTACTTLVVTQLVGIRTNVANFIVMVPAVFLTFSIFVRRWGRTGQIMILLGTSIIFIISWILPTYGWISLGENYSASLFIIVAPLGLLFGLYWVRWWTIRSWTPI